MWFPWRHRPTSLIGIALALVIAVLANCATPSVKPHPLELIKTTAPYWSTPYVVVDKMLELAELTPDDVAYDLGCGDGRILIEAARRHGMRAVGFDLDPERIKEARAGAVEAGVADLVDFQVKDIFSVDLSRATVVFLYLLPSVNIRLKPQLKQLPSGSRVVSHEYGIFGVKPSFTAVVPGPRDAKADDAKPEEDRRTKFHKVHLWRMPWGD